MIKNDQTTTMTVAAAAAAAVVAVDIKYIKDELTEIKCKLDTAYVTQTEFKPIRQIVYGMVSVVLLSMVGAIIALVLK